MFLQVSRQLYNKAGWWKWEGRRREWVPRSTRCVKQELHVGQARERFLQLFCQHPKSCSAASQGSRKKGHSMPAARWSAAVLH